MEKTLSNFNFEVLSVCFVSFMYIQYWFVQMHLNFLFSLKQERLKANEIFHDFIGFVFVLSFRLLSLVLRHHFPVVLWAQAVQECKACVSAL